MCLAAEGQFPGARKLFPGKLRGPPYLGFPVSVRDHILKNTSTNFGSSHQSAQRRRPTVGNKGWLACRLNAFCHLVPMGGGRQVLCNSPQQARDAFIVFLDDPSLLSKKKRESCGTCDLACCEGVVL